ncbi:UbiA prenyltransferase family-domain-containing protein [Daldinia eschscholtzii]|nr:UbiA prenyltransferase family-domain-containing protein [Daldinia eschscholtzii]
MAKHHTVLAGSQSGDVYTPPEHTIPSKSVRTVRFHLKTMFLFTKSDFKTVILPQSIFSLALVLSDAGKTMAPTQNLAEIALRIPYMFMWLWLHLLVEDVANQRLPEAILEDKENKPWRPIPTKRLTPKEAQKLLRVAVIIACGSNLFFRSFMPSTSLITLIWLYNDLDGNSAGVLQRNAITTLGLCSFGWGSVTTLLAGDISPEGNKLLSQWIALTGSMVATTIQVQDFPDIAGDIVRKRKTMPLVYGQQLSRWSLALFTIVWSIACPAFWDAVVPAWLVVLFLGGAMVILTALRWDQSSNERLFVLWCCWSTAIHLLPLFSNNVI